MDELNQVLERMQNTLKERNANTSSTPPHGSTEQDGNPITHTNTILPSPAGNQKQSALTQSTPQKRSSNDKKQLMHLIAQTCALQKQYGKTQNELETLVEGFNWVLDGYDMHEIHSGFVAYLKTSNDIPAPADIIAIMDENRKYAKYMNTPVETLQRWKDKGIPLSNEQEEKIKGLTSG